MKYIKFIILMCFATITFSAYGQYFKCTDSQGNSTFSSSGCKPNETEVDMLKRKKGSGPTMTHDEYEREPRNSHYRDRESVATDDARAREARRDFEKAHPGTYKPEQYMNQQQLQVKADKREARRAEAREDLRMQNAVKSAIRNCSMLGGC